MIMNFKEQVAKLGSVSRAAGMIANVRFTTSALAEGVSKTIEYEKGYVSRETLCKKSYKS